MISLNIVNYMLTRIAYMCGVTIRTTACEKNVKQSPKVGSFEVNHFSTLIRTTACENFYHIRTTACENFYHIYPTRTL